MSAEQSLKLYVVLSKAFRSINDHINDFIYEAGLNPTEFAVLELLYHKGEQPLQKIGDKILIASGSITYVVDKLEAKGFLRRVNCAEDRRITYAAITDEGKIFIDKFFPTHIDNIDLIMNILDEDEKSLMIELLKKVGKAPKNPQSTD